MSRLAVARLSRPLKTALHCLCRRTTFYVVLAAEVFRELCAAVFLIITIVLACAKLVRLRPGLPALIGVASSLREAAVRLRQQKCFFFYSWLVPRSN